MEKRSRAIYASRIAVLVLLALAPLLFCAQSAYADMSSRYWYAPTQATKFDYTKIIKTYGVRAGSAGADFLGITNTNFDFSAASPTSYTASQYTSYSANDLNGVLGAGLALWATDMNENVNPFYANLYYKSFSDAGYAIASATTWVANPDESSWGDSNNIRSAAADGSYTINGLEYSPEIIFGANKYTNWGNADYSSTNIYKAAAKSTTYNPTFVCNDVTNAWSMIYSLHQLAQAAEKVKATTGQTTRYDNNNAVTGALSYEKSIRGNMLYIASQIDTGKAEKKTVAYLYAIKNGVGYFFIPEADGLVEGEDTNGGSGGEDQTIDEALYNVGVDNYAANNATIDLDYMGVLPFITNTFTGGTAISPGIIMSVESSYKVCPGTYVKSTDTSALKDVDVIIYNSTTLTDLTGTSGGKNSNGIGNSFALTDSNVATWAEKHGFDTDSGLIIAGSDFGTSTNQGYGTKAATESGMAPLLYCQRNYTEDKLSRVAWAFSKVYPELYGNNENATYGYWVDTVYHLKTAWVPKAVAYMTNQSDTVTYTVATYKTLESYYKKGLEWWVTTGSKKAEWNKYAYYNGSSRASYFDGNTASEEPEDQIGIFQPSEAWLATLSDTSVDKSELSDSISDAKVVLQQKLRSVDGTDILPTVQWVDATTYDALSTAITLSQEVFDDDSATQLRVDAAVENLEEKCAAYEAAAKPGTATAVYTEFMSGYYLVRYAPSANVEAGCATYKGEAMKWDEALQAWVCFTTEEPTDLASALAVDAQGTKVSICQRTNAMDVTGNGKVNIADVQTAYDVAAQKYAFSADTEETWLLSDINGDGYADAADSRAAQYALFR